MLIGFLATKTKFCFSLVSAAGRGRHSRSQFTVSGSANTPSFERVVFIGFPGDSSDSRNIVPRPLFSHPYRDPLRGRQLNHFCVYFLIWICITGSATPTV
jgi:hypothetical protein